MKPSAVAVDFGAPDPDYNLPRSDSSFGFEDVSYPTTHHWSAAQEEQQLPLYSMSEGEARRRVRTGATGGGAGGFDPYEKERYDDDDEGKDVYNKPRAAQRQISSGRIPQHHLPPPTSIVSRPPTTILHQPTYLPTHTARIPLPKPRTHPSRNIHPPLLLDALPQNRRIQHRRVG